MSVPFGQNLFGPLASRRVRSPLITFDQSTALRETDIQHQGQEGLVDFVIGNRLVN